MRPKRTIKYSAMTRQSMFYMAKRTSVTHLRHPERRKAVEHAATPLKLPAKRRELTIASTAKTPGTESMETRDITSSPVMIFLTTRANQPPRTSRTAASPSGVLANTAQHTESIIANSEPSHAMAVVKVRHEAQSYPAASERASVSCVRFQVVNDYATQADLPQHKTKSRALTDHLPNADRTGHAAASHTNGRRHASQPKRASTARIHRNHARDIEIATPPSRSLLRKIVAPKLPEPRRSFWNNHRGASQSLRVPRHRLYEQRFSRKGDVRRLEFTFGDSQLKRASRRGWSSTKYLPRRSRWRQGRVDRTYTLSYDPDHDQTTSHPLRPDRREATTKPRTTFASDPAQPARIWQIAGENGEVRPRRRTDITPQKTGQLPPK